LAHNNELLEQLTNQEYSSANWTQSEKLVYHLPMPPTATWQQKTIVTYIDLNLLHRNSIKEYKIADEWNKHWWNWYIKGLFFLHMVQRTFGCIFFVWFSVSVFDTEYVICVTWEGECLKYFNDTVVFHYTQNLPLGCTDTRTPGSLCSG